MLTTFLRAAGGWPSSWGDTFVVPANSQNKRTAQLFVNFLMRPEISARMTNENLYPTANAAARPFIETKLLADTVVFPPDRDVRRAETILPLSDAGRRLYDGIWARFLEAK